MEPRDGMCFHGILIIMMINIIEEIGAGVVTWIFFSLNIIAFIIYSLACEFKVGKKKKC